MTDPRPPAPAIRLRKNLGRTVRAGHPWIYADALADRPALSDGTPVTIMGTGGATLGWGFWDGASDIAVRVIEAGANPPSKKKTRALIEERLRRACKARLAEIDRSTTNAFRWVHGEADRLPGIHVDLYDDIAVIRHDGGGARAFYQDMAGLPAALVAAARPIKIRKVIDRDKRDSGETVEVRENGLRFGVDLGRGQKGGLFLDQRENRAAAAKLARGASVLNLFGYTGAFSVHAAAAGARSTDTVDIGKGAIEAARDNFVRNGLSLAGAGFHAVDAFVFLNDAIRTGRRWDVVISDPPSFAPSRAAVPAARLAYRRLHRLAAAVVSPGGLLCAASCSSHFDRTAFRASIDEGVAAAGRRFSLLELRGAGFDHPVRRWFPEGDYLKFAVGRVTDATAAPGRATGRGPSRGRKTR